MCDLCDRPGVVWLFGELLCGRHAFDVLEGDGPGTDGFADERREFIRRLVSA